MYQDLKESYWWPNMKKEIAEWIRLPKTKSNHDAIWVVIDRLTKSAHLLPINERFSLEKLVKLYLDEIVMRHRVPVSIVSDRDPSYHASIGMPPYEALYGRKCRSPTYWDEVGERKLIGPELVQQTKEKVEMIQKRLVAAQDRQTKYANQERKNVQFEPGDKVLLKISPWKGLSRFGKKGKLSPRYIGPFEKYNSDASHVIELEPVEIQPDLSYVEQPVRILDRKERTLRNKVVPLVRVLWRNPLVEESTWELESEMKEKYPHLFA
ncbi:hypothetical protein AgCh_017896 [Apium graveolens]